MGFQSFDPKGEVFTDWDALQEARIADKFPGFKLKEAAEQLDGTVKTYWDRVERRMKL
jgi:hypothetical protein